MRWILFACSTALAFAQGTEPKPKAADYEVQGKSGQIEIGAEFMVHSFGGQRQTFIADDFLIVEVAFYPPKGETFQVNSGAFTLRVNGKKPALSPMPPASFAATFQRSGKSGGFGGQGGGLGGGGGLGIPFPKRGPPGLPGGMDKSQSTDAGEVAVSSALPEGETQSPVSGFLYFPYRGKLSAIKSLELVYDRAVLTLR